MGAATQVVPSVRSGAFGYGESVWRITVNGVAEITLVNTAAKVTIIAQWVYDQILHSAISSNINPRFL